MVGSTYYMGFVGNLLGFPAVKEFWKSVKNWQSYCHEFGVQFFLAHPVDINWCFIRASGVYNIRDRCLDGRMDGCLDMWSNFFPNRYCSCRSSPPTFFVDSYETWYACSMCQYGKICGTGFQNFALKIFVRIRHRMPFRVFYGQMRIREVVLSPARATQQV